MSDLNGCAAVPIGIQRRPKPTFFEAFVDRYIDVVGDSLLTLLFGLFCTAIAGLLPCILTFRRHGSWRKETAKKEIKLLG